jgi:hypothetical protein
LVSGRETQIVVEGYARSGFDSFVTQIVVAGFARSGFA